MTDKYIKLFYGENGQKAKKKHLYLLLMRNFVDLNLRIRSNSREFLKLFRRMYSMFFISQVNRYYRKNFRKTKNVHFDIIFDKGRTESLLKGFIDLERHIKYLLWGRFTFLHASCVRYNNFNLFFLGQSKSGKSTICSAMRERDGTVLSEEYALLETRTRKVYIFPTIIGDIRAGIKTNIQQKYFYRLKKYEKIGLDQNVVSMKETEFKILLDYHRKLYGICRDLLRFDFDGSKNIFILLRNNAQDKKRRKRILIRKEPIDILPELMRNVAANSEYYSLLMKEALGLFLESRCYILERAPLDLMVSSVCSRFK